MTVAAAQAAAASLRDALQDYGVRTSIELQPGVGPKTDPWGPAPFVRNLAHHIASYPPGTPGLAVVKNGRKGTSPLQGPLANCYGGFDLVARIITMGWANHPGAGGPWPVPGWGTVPRDNGRPYALGWEFEGGYLPYTDEMHDFMSRCGAASLDWLGTHNRREPAPLECHDEHKGWAPGRKPDRIGYITASGRSRIAAVRGVKTPGGFLMALNDDQQAEVFNGVKRIEQALGLLPIPVWNDRGAVGVKTAREVLGEIHAAVTDPTAAVNVRELAGELAPLLSAQVRGLSDADLAAFATAAADELDRRVRDGDPATGPVS